MVCVYMRYLYFILLPRVDHLRELENIEVLLRGLFQICIGDILERKRINEIFVSFDDSLM